jgi:hypothetical protein
MGVGLSMKTTYRFTQNGGGVKAVVKAGKLVEDIITPSISS